MNLRAPIAVALSVVVACGNTQELDTARHVDTEGDSGAPDAEAGPVESPDSGAVDVEASGPVLIERTEVPDAAPTEEWIRASAGGQVFAVAIEPDGAIYATGWFEGTVDLDPGEGKEVWRANGTDVFLSKLSRNGTLVWTRTWGGPDREFGDQGMALSVTGDGGVLVGGQFCETVDFDPGPERALHTSRRCLDAFVSRFSADGEHVWTHTMGEGGIIDRVTSIVTNDEQVFVGGQIDFAAPSAGLPSAGVDFFAAGLDENGNASWETTWGSSGPDGDGPHLAIIDGELITVSDIGNLHVTRIELDGEPIGAQTFEAKAAVRGIASDGEAVWIGGIFREPIDLDPGPGRVTYEALSEFNAYVLRLGKDLSYGASNAWSSPTTGGANTIDVAAGNGIAVSIGAYGYESLYNPELPVTTTVRRLGSDASILIERSWTVRDGLPRSVAIDSDGFVVVGGNSRDIPAIGLPGAPPDLGNELAGYVARLRL